MQKEYKIIANAKVNLSLYITGREGNLHTLDSVMASVDFGDEVTITESKKTEIIYDTNFSIENCTVQKAIDLFCEKFGEVNIKVEIKKNIPLASGLGGSSADAAAVLKILSEIKNIPLNELIPIAKKVGSDVPFMLFGGFARVSGTGDKLEFFDPKTSLYLVLAMHSESTGVSAKDSYAQFQSLTANGTISRPSPLAPLFHNDLQAPSISLDKTIPLTLQALSKTNPLATSMSGSGSACFALYPSIALAKAAAKKLAGQGYWAVAHKCEMHCCEARSNPDVKCKM